MIEINCLEKNGQVCELTVKGHANYDEKGKDIVCSAVSAIVVGGLNALKNTDEFDIIIESGYINLKVLKDLSEENKIVLNTILIQLYTIEKSYSKYIRISKS